MGRMKKENKGLRDNKGRYRPGHGTSCKPYKYVLSSRLKKKVSSYRREVIEDLGGRRNITTQKLLLLNKAMSLYGISLLLEERLASAGPFQGKGINPILTTYTAIIGQMRLLMKDIGLTPEAPRRRTPEELRAEIAKRSGL